MSTDQPTLDWTLAIEGSALVLTVEVANTTDSVIYVCDRLVTNRGGELVATDAITVMNDDAPGTVKFALASVSADEPSTVLYTPTFIRLEPGARHRRRFELAYPLKAWHPVAGVTPIRADAHQAVLLVHYFAGEPESFKTLADGATVPEGYEPRLLRSDPRPL